MEDTAPKSAEQMIKEHRARKAAMIQKENEQHFSYGLEATLTNDEREANKKLTAMRQIVANNDTLNRTIHNFFENKPIIEASTLYKVLNVMPKGAIHHLHTTAANPIDAYLKLTYDDRVYYNAREGLFKVYPKKTGIADGYLATTTLREFSVSPEAFDAEVKKSILLGPEESDNMESHHIWKYFQQKFTKVGELGKFIPFF